MPVKGVRTKRSIPFSTCASISLALCFAYSNAALIKGAYTSFPAAAKIKDGFVVASYTIRSKNARKGLKIAVQRVWGERGDRPGVRRI